MTEHPKARARMLARQGLVAFVMDSFGFPITSADHGRASVAALRADPSVLHERAFAGLEILRAYAAVDPQRIAAIGFCFGGTTVLELARDGADINGVISFHGGLSTQKTLPYGTPDDVRRECRKLLELGRDGGYIFNAAHAVEGDVPLENLVAMIETVTAQKR